MFSLRKAINDFKRKVKYDNSNESFINVNNIWFDPKDNQFVYLVTYTEDRAQDVIEFISGFNCANFYPSVKWVLGNGGFTSEGITHEGGKSETIYHNRYYILFRFKYITEVISYIKSLDNEVLDKILDDYCDRINAKDADLSNIVIESGIFINRRFVGCSLNYNALIDNQSNLNYILERVPECFNIYDVIQVSCKKTADKGCVGLYTLPSSEIKKYYSNYDETLSAIPPIFYLNDEEDDDIKGYLSHDEIDSFFTDDIYRLTPLDLQEMNIDEILSDDEDVSSKEGDGDK